MVPNRKRVSDEEVTASYSRSKSIYITAKDCGLCPQSVHERLVRLGIARSLVCFTEAEIDRMRREYIIYRNAGKLDDLARLMIRPKTSLCRVAREIGLTDGRHSKSWLRIWNGMTEETARVLFEDFKSLKCGMSQFCSRRKIGSVGFSQTMQRFFPDEWEAVIESKMPRTGKYKLGRAFEYQVRDVLKKHKWFVLRSPRSAGPLDLVAIRKRHLWFIQCKRSGSLDVEGWNSLFHISMSVDAIPVLAGRPNGLKMIFWELLEEKTKRTGKKREIGSDEMAGAEPPLRVGEGHCAAATADSGTERRSPGGESGRQPNQ